MTDPKPLHERLREEEITAAHNLAAYKNSTSLGTLINRICALAERAKIASALEEQAAARPEPVAYIEHHKGGDNLVWDNPGGKYTPLYAAPAAAQGAQPVAWRDVAMEILTVQHEMAQRGKLFPQNSDYHRENARMFKLVAEILEWFDGRGHAPKLYAAPQVLDGEKAEQEDDRGRV